MSDSYYKKNKAKILEKMRLRYQHDKEYRSKRIREASVWNQNNPNREAILKKYNSKSALQIKARRIINNKINDGYVIREPCEICGAEVTEAHHEDYLQPLNVRWFCTAHHAAWHKVFAVAVLLLVLAGCSPGGRFGILEQNDYLGGRKTDQLYTQGAKFTYSFPKEQDGTTDSLSFSNTIYNPKEKHTPDIVRDERPYAGYSYVEGRRKTYPRSSVENTFAIQLGTVGPASGGKFFQCGVHKLLDQKCPEGWANQIKNEPTIVLQAEQRKKLPINTYSDTVLDYGGQLGNVRTGANIGGIVRLGILGSDFGPDDITPRIERTGATSALRESFTSAYGFLGTAAKGVVRNIFLDGNTFEASHRVTKEPLIGEFKAGFTLQYKEIKLTYSWVTGTNEYKDSRSNQTFGSVDISWGW